MAPQRSPHIYLCLISITESKSFYYFLGSVRTLHLLHLAYHLLCYFHIFLFTSILHNTRYYCCYFIKLTFIWFIHIFFLPFDFHSFMHFGSDWNHVPSVPRVAFTNYADIGMLILNPRLYSDFIRFFSDVIFCFRTAHWISCHVS